MQREHYRAKGQDTFVQKVFGTQGDQDGSAGAVVMTDATGYFHSRWRVDTVHLDMWQVHSY